MQTLIDNILTETNYANNPYFVALKEKRFAKDDFVETQIQFYFAVLFFSRPMAAVAAKVPNPMLRLAIIRNVWEEHGDGDLTNLHGHTFSELLHRLGVNEMEEIHKRALWPQTRRFNTVLAGACGLDEYLVGVSTLGIIELMFSDISNLVGNGIIHNGWVSKDKMIHYNLHEKLDIKHAQDFFDVLTPNWESGNPEDRYFIEQGLRLGAFAFNSFYEDLYKARELRRFREVRCYHSRS